MTRFDWNAERTETLCCEPMKGTYPRCGFGWPPCLSRISHSRIKRPMPVSASVQTLAASKREAILPALRAAKGVIAAAEVSLG